jgi:hypothetical protein
MLRRFFILAVSLALAAPAWAQGVQVTPLAPPDAFSTPGRDTGLPHDLWRGTSAQTARIVLPLLATKPLSPAAAALARRLLATGAPGPEGSSGDAALAGARVSALIALGDPQAAARILERAPGVERSAELSQAAAEAALLTGDDTRACQIADALTVGRDDVYWLRLRAYCQAVAGSVDVARLTFDLAQAQEKDAVYGRLMMAMLSGASPGAASLRNGLDYALSRRLTLDLAAAKPAPAVAAALAGGAPSEPTWDAASLDATTGGMASAIATGVPPPAGVSAMIAAAAEADAKARARLQAAALLAAALLPELPADDRARIAAFDIPAGKAPAGRNLALQDAARRGAAGEAALIALWTAVDAGPDGLALGDRVCVVQALARVGLTADARALALEGLAGLK